MPGIIDTGYYEVNYAIVEFFHGKNIDEYQEQGGNIKDKSEKILEMLNKMDNHTRAWYGSPLIDKANDISSEQLMYDYYSHELEIAASLDGQVQVLQPSMQRILSIYFENIRIGDKAQM